MTLNNPQQKTNQADASSSPTSIHPLHTTMRNSRQKKITPATQGGGNTIKNLEKYKEMFEKGLISNDEYERLKSKELWI
tara:strand:+ start:485 stop:721 length:237 start_codon:yes stop_codon:yes gene_type:complete